jgi:electron transfer flavoprotein alpha subunit
MVLFVAEHANGELRKSALELARLAADLAGKLGGEAVGLVMAEDAGAPAQALAEHAPRVVAVSDPELRDVRAEPYRTVISQVAQDLGAKVVLVPASKSGLSYSPRVAVRLGAPLLEDVIALDADGEHLVAKRYSYLARVTETVKSVGWPVVVSVKPNVFPVSEGGAGGQVETRSAQLEPDDTRVKVGEKAAAKRGRVALEEAEVVITGGRGVGGAEGFAQYVEPLADALNAGIGSTRAVVDAGWRPYAEQVGQTGKTVAPKLYIALGVSGAVQHLSGMNRSKVVVAVNKDPDAPIFKVADYGIVGDVKEVAPALKEALSRS